jgi:hypothetical protein
MTKLRHLFDYRGELIDVLLDAVESANEARLAADPDLKGEVIEAAEPLHALTRKLAAEAMQVTEVRVLHQCPRCGHRKGEE